MAEQPSVPRPRNAAEKPPRKHRPTIPPVFQPAEWELADASALQALERGNASPDQQKRALTWILRDACGMGDFLYRPGEDGRRDTDFALGREFPAKQIVKLLRLNLAAFQRRDPRADPHHEA